MTKRVRTTEIEIDEALLRVASRGLLVRAGEVTALDEGERTFEATVLTYGSVDSYDTTFAPGLFAKSLATKMPALAWAHDWSDVIGRAVAVVRDDDTSLVLKFRVDNDDVPRAKQAWTQLHSGSLDEFSVGFVPIQAREVTRDSKQVVEFVEGTLEEVSIVMRGAVPGTALESIAQVRSRLAEPDTDDADDTFDADDAADAAAAEWWVTPPVERFDVAPLVRYGPAEFKSLAKLVLDEYAPAVRTGKNGARFMAVKDVRRAVEDGVAVGRESAHDEQQSSLQTAFGEGSLTDDQMKAAYVECYGDIDGFDASTVDPVDWSRLRPESEVSAVDDELDPIDAEARAALARVSGHVGYTEQRADGGDLPSDDELDAYEARAKRGRL